MIPAANCITMPTHIHIYMYSNMTQAGFQNSLLLHTRFLTETVCNMLLIQSYPELFMVVLSKIIDLSRRIELHYMIVHSVSHKLHTKISQIEQNTHNVSADGIFNIRVLWVYFGRVRAKIE